MAILTPAANYYEDWSVPAADYRHLLGNDVSFRENIRNFAGVRANTDKSDFIIAASAAGFITLGGIKSPGLSSAPAIAEEAVKLLKNADVLIVGGTSLMVNPAASLINYFSGSCLALINISSTPYDSQADIIIREKIGETFTEIYK